MKFSKDEEYAIEEVSKLSETELIEQIKQFSLSAWNGDLESITLKAWLNNFTGEVFGNSKAERNLALWITLHFVLYTDQDVRSLSVNLWWKFIHEQLEKFEASGFMSDNTLQEKHKYIIDNTVIQPLGNCGGSGANVCYFFRQSNSLKKEMFDIKKDADYQYLVLVDDVTVSGYQAKTYLDRYNELTDKSKYILTFISTVKAREHIGDSAYLISSIELDEKSKCFSENSYVFSRHKNWLSIAEKMCKHYGLKLSSRYPLGFRDGQYLFGFYYNIPNNTLPIFWGTLNEWTPLFTRYFSNYDRTEEENNEKFF